MSFGRERGDGDGKNKICFPWIYPFNIYECRRKAQICTFQLGETAVAHIRTKLKRTPTLMDIK